MKFVKILVSSILLAFIIGCTTTIIPKPITGDQPSWDQGVRDSGFYGFYTNKEITYAIISMHARDRYNVLVYTYSNKIPTITFDYGIQNNKTNCYMTLEALSSFMKMNRWLKEDFKH